MPSIATPSEREAFSIPDCHARLTLCQNPKRSENGLSIAAKYFSKKQANDFISPGVECLKGYGKFLFGKDSDTDFIFKTERSCKVYFTTTGRMTNPKITLRASIDLNVVSSFRKSGVEVAFIIKKFSCLFRSNCKLLAVKTDLLRRQPPFGKSSFSLQGISYFPGTTANK